MATASWSDNIEAVARDVTTKRLAHDGISEDQLAADVDMWWHLSATELECGIVDETVEYVRGEIDWNRKMDGYCRRHCGRGWRASGTMKSWRGLRGWPD